MVLITALIVLGVLVFGTGLFVHGLLWLLIVGGVLLVGGLAWGTGRRIGSRRNRELP